ncbi:winged helix-turn-helix domain-containing protein [Actinosynnema sp. NPDC059797]
MLAALAVDAGRVVPVDRLVERVWGAEAAPRARATLHGYISRLRHALAGVDGAWAQAERDRLEQERQHRNHTGEANSLDSLGYVEHNTGNHRPAIDHYRQALALRCGLGGAGGGGADAAVDLDERGRRRPGRGRGGAPVCSPRGRSCCGCTTPTPSTTTRPCRGSSTSPSPWSTRSWPAEPRRRSRGGRGPGGPRGRGGVDRRAAPGVAAPFSVGSADAAIRGHRRPARARA